ncbi:MAG: zinc ABC transporter substrate-binding protein [Chlamydiota bacterium]
MRTLFYILLASLTFLWLLPNRSIFPRTEERNTRPLIVSTTSMIGDLVTAIVGDHLDHYVLIRGELDPHGYQLVKGDADRFDRADIVFCNGLGLEHGVSLVQALQQHPRAVYLGDQVRARIPEKILSIEGAWDPHIWMDVSLWMEASYIVEEVLSIRFSEYKPFFQRNATSLRQKWSRLHTYLLTTVAQIPEEKRYIVTSHDAFSYFVRTYFCEGKHTWQERLQAPAGLAPDGKLSFHDLATTLQYIEKFSVATIFPESNLSQASLKKIVQCSARRGQPVQIAKQALYGDTMGNKSYPEMMRHNADVLREWLQ